MKLYGLLEKFKSLIGTRQTVAPTPDNNEAAFYINTNGDPAYVKDAAGVETASHLPTATQKVTLTAASASDVAVTIPNSGTLETVTGAAAAAAAAVTAHKDLTTGVHGAGTGTLLITDAIQTVTNKYIDGGTAGSNNKIKLPQDTYANILILTPTEGLVVYATDVDTVFVGDGTNWIAVGSGTGQGRKNYIQNPSASTSASQNWTISNTTDFTVTKDTSTSIPRETTTGSAFKLVSKATNATFTSAARMTDDADAAKRLAGEIAINVLTAGNWTIEVQESADGVVPGTWTRISLTTDVAGVTTLPLTSGTFKFAFDTRADKRYIRVQIKSAAAADTTAYFSDILLTPDGSTVVGAVVEDWLSFASNPTNLPVASSGTASYKYRRVGTDMEILISMQTAVSASTSEATLTLPLNINTNVALNAVKDDGAASYGSVVGTWTSSDSASGLGSSDKIMVVKLNSSNVLCFTYGSLAGATAQITQVAGPSYTKAVIIRATVPIAEWAGSGTCNVAGNDVEYVSHDGSAVVRGSAGAVIPTTTPSGASDQFTLTFQTPVQVGDLLILETQRGGSGVWDQQYVPSARYDGTNYIGASVENDSANGVVIRKGKYLNGTSLAWSSITAGTRWRVRKVSATSVAGFEMASATSAGLMSTQAQTIAGVKTFNAGLVCGTGNGTIANISSTTFGYTSGNFSLTGCTLAGTITFNVMRVGNIVTFSCGGTIALTAASYSLVFAPPAGYISGSNYAGSLEASGAGGCGDKARMIVGRVTSTPGAKTIILDGVSDGTTSGSVGVYWTGTWQIV